MHEHTYKRTHKHTYERMYERTYKRIYKHMKIENPGVGRFLLRLAIMKTIMQPLGTKKNYATSQDKKKT